MRKEYNLKKLKVKRRGLLPGLQKEDAMTNKVRITISLDKDVIDYFKSEAKHPGAFPYQTQINQALRKLVDKSYTTNDENIDILKEKLLNDPDFIHSLTKKMTHKQQSK